MPGESRIRVTGKINLCDLSLFVSTLALEEPQFGT